MNDWKMKLTVCRRKANRSLRDALERSVPPTSIEPPVAVSSAPIRLSSVVFPHPDGPVSYTHLRAHET